MTEDASSLLGVYQSCVAPSPYVMSTFFFFVLFKKFPQLPSVEGLTLSAIYHRCDDRGKKQVKENLERVVSRCIDKELADRSYFHDVFDFFSSLASAEELQSMLSLLQECLPLLLSTRAGSLVGNCCYQASRYFLVNGECSESSHHIGGLTVKYYTHMRSKKILK